MIALLLAAQGLSAERPVPAPQSGPCRVVEIAKSESATQIAVDCGSLGVMLGWAESYRSAYNPALGLLVVTSSGRGERVRLVSTTDEGIHVDDVTRDLNKLGGRNADAPLTLSVDTDNFARTGKIAVEKATMGLKASRADVATAGKMALTNKMAPAQQRSAMSPAVSAELDLAPLVSPAAARRENATTPMPSAKGGQ